MFDMTATTRHPPTKTTMLLLLFNCCYYNNSSTIMPGCILASNQQQEVIAKEANTTGTTTNNDNSKKPRTFRRRHVQIVHRHGDRSPITSLLDETYWTSQLIPSTKLAEIAEPTTVISDNVVSSHKANGRGPFGKLTTLGLQQMVDLGILLKEELSSGGSNNNETKLMMDDGTILYPHIFTPNDTPLEPTNIKVVSTSFERAIQSVQGVLVGLFPPPPSSGDTSTTKKIVSIDARHTNIMLPDPQPRRSQEQIDLEDALAGRPHLQVREEELLPLAVRVTKALHPLLAADANEASFGAKQVQLKHISEESIEIEPLAWNQLAEICKCLSVRNMLLPLGITEEDHHAVVAHAAWRWFETFRHRRLAYLSMHTLCMRLVDETVAAAAAALGSTLQAPPLILYSAHDSTLIGLLCAFKLEQPVQWPEYGSYWMMELLEEEFEDGTKNRFYVRFSLNGELLRHMWEEDDQGQPKDMILLDRLVELLKDEGKASEGMTS